MSLDNLPFNLFDLALVAMVVGGIMQGRKHGMSEELLDLLKWLAIVVVCGMYYEPLGQLLARSSSFSLLSCYLGVYLGGAVVIFMVFGLVRHHLGGKLVGSDIFGRLEYYLGMGSGMLRFLCISVVALSALHARYFPPAEIKAQDDYQKKWFENNFFPTWYTVQHSVFDTSMTGPWIKGYLSSFLIRPTVLDSKSYQQQEAQWP